MEATVGGIINKFKIKKRRDILFFGDILATYIKECEEAGYTADVEQIGKKWMLLFFARFMPSPLTKLPPMIFLNSVMGRVWANLGLLTEFHATKKNNIVRIETKNEGITELIEDNVFLVSLYVSVLNVLFRQQVENTKMVQTREFAEYTFRLKDERFNTGDRTRPDYIKLNYLPTIKGFMLKDALKKGIFDLKKNNKIYFRRTHIYLMENTLFHLIGNKRLLMDRVAHISHRYFEGIVHKESSKEEKLILFKTLLQTMGWGIVEIVSEPNAISFTIKNPPYGLQLEKDNWDFLANTILGYLWLVDSEFKITRIKEKYKNLSISYSI